MSFCANVKAELSRHPLNKKCCAVAEAYGVLLFCNTFSPQALRIVTESRDFALRLPKLFRKPFDLVFDQVPDGDTGKQVFQIDDPEKLLHIYETFGLERETMVSLHVNLSVLEEECCRISFLRGAFMAGGSVTDPEKRYHLELATSHLRVSREVYSLLMELGFFPKDTMRGGNSILYFKQSDYIEDVLTPWVRLFAPCALWRRRWKKTSETASTAGSTVKRPIWERLWTPPRNSLRPFAAWKPTAPIGICRTSCVKPRSCEKPIRKRRFRNWHRCRIRL